ncbi:CDHR2-like protein [Mya arenaria]|uniref:CDHR2-like protein n=1 Tax=Mya arenaria TaxID=6604 RepID=A0ABY7EJJ2_MYAAR|nr:CDHR2-like protein [Mya arenaria]
MKGCALTSALVLLAIFRESDAAVTAWSSPSPGISATAADGSITIPSSAAVAEDAAVGDTLFTATATVSGTASYVLVDDAGGKGTIGASTGVVTLATGQSLDFETATTLVFKVEATDSTGGGKGTATITLPITNVNEAPSFAKSVYGATAVDASAAGTTVGTYTATDPDASDTITYSIQAGNTNTDFAISSAGVVTVNTGKTLAMSTTAAYSLTLRATDAASLTGDTTLVIYVGDCDGSGAVAVASTLASLLLASFVT